MKSLPQEVKDKIEARVSLINEPSENGKGYILGLTDGATLALEAMQGEPEIFGWHVHYGSGDMQGEFYKTPPGLCGALGVVTPLYRREPMIITGKPLGYLVKCEERPGSGMQESYFTPSRWEKETDSFKARVLRTGCVTPLYATPAVAPAKTPEKPIICLNCKRIWTIAPEKCVCGHWSYGDAHPSTYKRAQVPIHENAASAKTTVDLQKLTEGMDSAMQPFVSGAARKPASNACAQIAMNYLNQKTEE